ncbi:hypothetical protein KOR42_48570 [Thalassoglobus neptunius]|uniref:Uncharacterized protein n=1 Tax=Thalassoglobus neptunius TaxID=1938619 RepID=A0A5C5VSZ2_9PLAN|nr:hypothetical protein [Thalassoglobus neptunius]TWT40861.1 hypothetical protein KOR42_48570 [Thalassoglobus neptunius]
MSTSTQQATFTPTPRRIAPTATEPIESGELAEELNRLEATERAELDRQRQEELARQRALARLD